MTTALQFATAQTDGNATTLLVRGEIDASNAAVFSDAVAQALHGGERITVDLTAVEYMDSAALATLFAHVDHIDIRITALNQTLLTVCGLADLTTVHVMPS